MTVADRRWQYRCGDDDWVSITGIDDQFVLFTHSAGARWRNGSWLPDPDTAGRLRYTVPVRGTWMAWKPGDFVLLAKDFDRQDIAAHIRAAQVERRQAHVHA